MERTPPGDEGTLAIIGRHDLDVIAGQPDILVGILQEYYWITKEEAEEQVYEFEEEVLSGEKPMLHAHA